MRGNGSLLEKERGMMQEGEVSSGRERKDRVGGYEGEDGWGEGGGGAAKEEVGFLRDKFHTCAPSFLGKERQQTR